MRIFMLFFIVVTVVFAERFETGCEPLFLNDAVWLDEEVVFFGQCDHKAWIGRYKNGKVVETKSFLRPQCESAEFKRAARLADSRITAVSEEVCDKKGVAMMAFFDKNGVTWRRWQKRVRFVREGIG